MPETPETHKEIVNIKKEITDIKQTQDAAIHRERPSWEELLFKTLDSNQDMMRVLLAVDCLKSAIEIEKECGLLHVKCWRLLDKLDRAGIIFKLDDTKQGSTVYCKSRWYRILRLDDEVQTKLRPAATIIPTIPQVPNVQQQSP